MPGFMKTVLKKLHPTYTVCVFFFSFFALDTINKADVILRMPDFFLSPLTYLPSVACLK